MATATQPKLIILTQDASDAFDVYLKQGDIKRKAESKGRKAGELKKEAQASITDELGDIMRAQLPDGRVIQRLKKGFDKKSQKATRVAWEELIESP